MWATHWFTPMPQGPAFAFIPFRDSSCAGKSRGGDFLFLRTQVLLVTLGDGGQGVQKRVFSFCTKGDSHGSRNQGQR